MTSHSTSDGWLLSAEDDNCFGFFWYATLHGVLWAKGWLCTRTEAYASAQAEIAGRSAASLEGRDDGARQRIAKVGL